MPSISAMEYQVGDPSVSFTVSEFTSQSAITCGFIWTYSATLTAEPIDGGSMADYITFDTQLMEFTIGSQSGVAQELEVNLIGSL